VDFTDKTESARSADDRPDPLDEFFYRPDETLAGVLDFPEEPVEVNAPEEPVREYLGFRLAQERYALDLRHVREIARVPLITELPRAPSFVVGVMNLRGEVMPVLDLHERLGLTQAFPKSKSARVVVVETDRGPAGLLVDAVEQVVRLRPSSIESPPPGLGGIQEDSLIGICRQKDVLFALLNLESVLPLPTPLGWS
jgi:purine-binding chemotaxis protein CheW